MHECQGHVYMWMHILGATRIQILEKGLKKLYLIVFDIHYKPIVRI